MRRGSPAAVIALALLFVAAPARAGTVSIGTGSGVFVFEAAAGEANRVTLNAEPGRGVRVVDGGAPLTAGENCAPADDGRGVICVFPDWVDGMRVELGDGDDVASARGLASDVVLYGEDGHDRIEASAGGRIEHQDPQRGTAPNLVGGPGDDVLTGGVGDDQLAGGAGADVVRGGPGADWVRYGGSPAGGAVTLDDRPGDGTPGENDDVGSDVEDVEGSPGDDVIVGSDGPNELGGLGGADVLDGRGGADRLVTGRGGDRLIGGAGADVFDAEIWDTQVEARDGERDRVECGARVVMLSADPFDSLAECAPAAARPRYSRLRVRRSGTAGLLLGCQQHSDIPCAGKILVRRELSDGRPSGPVIGRGRFRIAADGSATRATVRFTAPFMRLLASRRKVAVEASLITLRARPRSSRTVPMALELLAPR